MKKILKITIFSLLTCCVVVFTLIGIYENVTSSVKFDIEKLTVKESNICFYDDTGEQIESYNGKISKPVDIDDLPPFVSNSFVAVEDKRFYQHHGTDNKRIVKALWNNLKSFSYKEGGSTISQQLIKNTHLSSDKNIKRKLCEIKLTKELEKKLSKKQILNAYLNTVYFGNGAFGIENAAESYFGKKAKDLSLKESATLAALLKAPALYSPYRNASNSEKRTALVLRLMKEQNYITENEYESALNDKTVLNVQKTETTGEIQPIQGYFLKKANEEAEKILEEYRISVYSKLKIYTYFDKSLQQSVLEAAQGNTENNNYTVILCDNKANGIKALVSSCEEGNLPPASTVKPWLVYAPAIEENIITQATKILDEKTDFNGFYPINNSGKYYGYVSVKECIEKSLNIPAVKIAALLKTEKLKEYGNKFGVKINDGLGVALGGIDDGIPLKQSMDIYSSFANGGNFSKNSFIKRIEDEKGKVLYQNTPENKRVFSEETAFLINDCLYSVSKNGTARKISQKNIEVCAKTGTNGRKNGNYNAFCISYSPEYTLAVHIGNPTNKIMASTVSGGTYPAIISGDIWSEISKKHTISKFSPPDGIVKITLDKENYENNYTTFKGTDGEEFYFKKGYEPKDLPSTITPNEINRKIQFNYSVKKGIFYFNLQKESSPKNDEDFGAEIYLIENNKQRKLLTTTDSCFSKKLEENTSYHFSIKPFIVTQGKKNYGNEIDLPEIKFNRNSNTTIDDWWNK